MAGSRRKVTAPGSELVDEYLASLPELVRERLRLVRAAIRRAIPDAEETISYKIPAYKVNGRVVLFFAGWKEHWSLYPAGAALRDAFGDELARYEMTKGTIKFPLPEPVPEDLVERIARYRAAARE